MSTKPLVIFGYGSLIFKPPPHVQSETVGYLKGFVRRFAQSSNDHRGTPENLGRVVTLISSEDWSLFSQSDPFPDDNVVWGVAYTIDPAKTVEVLQYLDYREKNGYSVNFSSVFGIQDQAEVLLVKDAMVYVGKRDNPAFVGSEDFDTLAARIHTAVGPSGANKDYLYALADAIRGLSSQSNDPYLNMLQSRVRLLDSTESAHSHLDQV